MRIKYQMPFTTFEAAIFMAILSTTLCDCTTADKFFKNIPPCLPPRPICSTDSIPTTRRCTEFLGSRLTCTPVHRHLAVLEWVQGWEKALHSQERRNIHHWLCRICHRDSVITHKDPRLLCDRQMTDNTGAKVFYTLAKESAFSTHMKWEDISAVIAFFLPCKELKCNSIADYTYMFILLVHKKSY